MATYSEIREQNSGRQLPVRRAYRDNYDNYDDYRDNYDDRRDRDRDRDRDYYTPRNAQMGPQRSRATRTFARGNNIVTEEVQIVSGRGQLPVDVKNALVRRQRDGRQRDESVEEIPRDFPPPSAAPMRRARSPRRPPPRDYRQYDDYEDDDRSQYSRRTRRDRSRSRSPTRSPSRRRSERGRKDEPLSESEDEKDKKKSTVDNVLEGLGLGGAAAGVKKLLGQRDGNRDRDRSGRHDASDSEGERGGDGKKKKGSDARRKWQQAAQAAVITGVIEAWRSKDEPGTWSGAKGIRTATAALSAGGIDGLFERFGGANHSKRHLIEAVLGGLAANHVVNGKRDNGDGYHDEATGEYVPARTPRSQSIMSRGISRMRSMSRGRGRRGSDTYSSDEEAPPEPERGRGKSTVKQLAGAGALAALGKSVYDRVRSKSRKRQQSESRSRSRSASRSRSRSRGARDDSRSRSRSSSRSSRSSSDDEDGRRRRGGQEADRNGFGRAVAPVAAGAGAGALATSNRRGGYDKDMMTPYADDTSDEEEIVKLEAEGKRMRGKELLTAGLATVATIHAANGVYSSMVAHEKRHKMVDAGTMTPAEARKKQTRAWVQDAAAVGIAALGIKGAFSEWKNMSEQRSVTGVLE